MHIEQTLDIELENLRRLAWRMDALFYIPRTNISVGLDNIIGLVPVVGDVATFVPSLYLIWKAKQLGASSGTLAYMIGNTLADLVIGSIPIMGDLFDMLYNANIRNFRALKVNLNKKAATAKEVRSTVRDLPLSA